MAVVNVTDGLPVALAASLALHVFVICLLIAGRAGPDRVAGPIAPGYAGADGTSAIAVDLLTFPGPHTPGRDAPTQTATSTAAQAPGAPRSQRGRSDRTILPTDLEPPTPILGMPQPAAELESIRPVARMVPRAESVPVVRIGPPTPPIDEPGAADIVVLPIGLPRTLAIGMPDRPLPEPVLPPASAGSVRPSSPDAGSFDRRLLPAEASPAPVAGAPDADMPRSPDVAAARSSPAGPDAGSGVASQTALPVDMLPVPMPARPPAGPSAASIKAPEPKPRAARPAGRRPRGADASTSRALDPFAHYGIYGESGTIASVNGIGGPSGAAAFRRQR